MISALDLNIYQALFQQKAITEKYVGKVEFDWMYSEVHYIAECTVGVPFDLFDKTIVGILQVDDVLTIEEIGDVLGMNVIHKPEKQQYKDEAEWNILRIALDSLKGYGMIETGDIYYSACRLTNIGKEYAQKGRKFKMEGNKHFSLVYDHTSQNHLEAKKIFQTLKGRNLSILYSDFDFLDENQMKQIAEKQASEVYNLEKGNSFTNPKIDSNKSQTFHLKIYVALLYDLENGNIRLLAYEPTTKTINECFTKWLNDNELGEIIEQCQNENIIDYSLSKLPKEHVQALTHKQQLFEKEITENPVNAMAIVKEINQNLEYVDVEYFWNNLGSFVSDSTKECWFFLPDYNHYILQKIGEFIAKKIRVFFIFQNSEDDRLTEELLKIFEQSKNSNANHFMIVIEELDKFLFFTDNKTLDLEEILIGNSYKFSCLHQNDYSIDIKEFKKIFIEQYLPIIEYSVIQKFNELNTANVVSKDIIIEFELIDSKALAFTDLQEHEEVLQQVYEIEKRKKEFITMLKEKQQIRLRSELQVLIAGFEKQEFSKLEPLQDFQNKTTALKIELFEDYEDLKASIIAFENKIRAEERRIRDEILAKTYIIDTNIFIEEPDIISKIDNRHYIALTLTAIEELDKLKTKEKTREKASKAIKYINEALQPSDKQKKQRVKKAKADLSLLPEELQKKSGDNYLLSMAYIYINENPVILTNDKNLQSKAIMLDIPIVLLNNLLGIKDQAKLTVKRTTTEIDYMPIFISMKPDKNGKYQISTFIETIKKQNPKFDYKELGFEKAWQFVNSLNIFEVVDRNFINLKNK